MTPRLQTIGLALGYEGGVFAHGIDLTLAPAEIVAILGPSGSGKSTLLNTIAGVVPPMGGRILVDGTDVTDLPIHRRGVGLIFQQPLLFPHLNVRDNVAYGLRRQGRDRDDARREADELLTWVDLAGYGDRRAHELSGGQAQRVALARALAPRPSVLLLDEPFSALDLDLRQRLAADVAATLRAHGVAALHVTHDPGEAAAIADRVVRLSDLVADGQHGQPLH
jgi:thiamine transport system ATP-binding protein